MTARSAIVAAAATASLAATPVAAADLPVSPSRSAVAVDHYDADAQNADRYRGYRYRGYRHRNRVDAGDVIAGVAVIGAIAAIASAANKNRDRDRYRDRRYPASYPSYDRTSGLDRAVDQCVREIERDARVGDVDGVDRTGSGWRVTGSLYNGDGFTCSIGNDGRIDGIDYGQRGFSGAGYGTEPTYSGEDDRQWDDAAYTQARANAGYAEPAASPTPDSQSQPAYPGGPVAGEYEYAEDDGYGG